jgi:hypothetical protein
MGRATLEGFAVKFWVVLMLSVLVLHAADRAMILAIGAEGEREFGEQFQKTAQTLEQAGAKGGLKFISIGVALPATNELVAFEAALTSEATNGTDELWIVLVGHGTWDGKEARFNLRGPDLTATRLNELLKPATRPVALVNCASASAPFMKVLAHTNRIVITATRAGAEENYARFGTFFAQALASAGADLDKDGQTSLLETFLAASRQVGEFYKSEGRLATEHALLDDNGDGLGTPSDWFRGVRAVRTPSGGAAMDGIRAHQWHLVRAPAEQHLSAEQRVKRDSIERAIASLRERKGQMPDDQYYRELEVLLTRLAPLVAPER